MHETLARVDMHTPGLCAMVQILVHMLLQCTKCMHAYMYT